MTISETTDRVQAIGREFLKPMPEGWGFMLSEIRNSEGKMSYVGRVSNPYCQKGVWEYHNTASTPDEARRLCREEAERKAGQ